jgi:cell division transport system permease protein
VSASDPQEPDSAPYPSLSRETWLIPADSIGGRALVVVIAIMTFLVCFTAGSATLIAEASRNWRDSVANDVTIQVKPRLGEDADGMVAKAVEAAKLTPGVADAHALTREESEQTLEPWLGRGLDLSQLPMPRLIVVTMKSSQAADLQSLRDALASAAPRASLDDHQLWISRLNAFGEIIVGLAIGLLSLMIVAMSSAIGFATRGAMAGNSEIISVLHFVGAADGFIARQFQSHFTRLGSRGAAIGGSAAALFFALAALLSYASAHSLRANAMGALFGEITLSAMGYVFIAILCVAIAALTGFISRAIVFDYLKRLF